MELALSQEDAAFRDEVRAAEISLREFKGQLLGKEGEGVIAPPIICCATRGSMSRLKQRGKHDN